MFIAVYLQQPRYRSNLGVHPTDEWVKIMVYKHTREYSSAIKKRRIKSYHF